MQLKSWKFECEFKLDIRHEIRNKNDVQEIGGFKENLIFAMNNLSQNL